MTYYNNGTYITYAGAPLYNIISLQIDNNPSTGQNNVLQVNVSGSAPGVQISIFASPIGVPLSV